MKKNLFAFLLPSVLTITLASCGGSGTREVSATKAGNEVPEASASQAAPVIKKYGIKSGIVTFEHSGFGITTKTILYFDDYGTKEAEEQYNDDGSLKETNLCDGKNIYLLIHKDKTAFSRGECFRGVAYKFDWSEASRSGAEYKPTKLSNQDIAGRDCESFSLDISGNKAVYAGWNNICFLIETVTGKEKVVYKAVSFEENANVPAEKFKVPTGYRMN
jgi:hypothetical protein